MREDKERLLNPVHFPLDIVVSSMVILANPSSSREKLTERLRELGERYDTGHRIRSVPDGFYSEELESYLGRLEMDGFTRGDFIDTDSLTEEAVELLETTVLEAAVEDSEGMELLARRVGYNLKALCYRYVKDYLELRRKKPEVF